VFRLERFKEGYSYVKHDLFIRQCISETFAFEKKRQFIKMHNDAEMDKWRKEALHE
jgi:hypothetical protein